MYALDVEALVGECLDLCTLLQGSWRKLRDLLFDEQIGDIDGAGKLGRELRHADSPIASKRVFQDFHLLRMSRKWDTRSPGSPNWSSISIEEMNSLKRTIEKEWPRIDAKMTDESLADYSQREVQICQRHY